MSDDKRAMLVHWITQRKLTTRENEDAVEDLQLWLKRSKMALDAGKIELARAAKDQAVIAREKVGASALRLKEIEAELEAIRSEPTIPNALEANAALQRAEHAAGEFAKMGIDTRFAGLGDPDSITLPDVTADTLGATLTDPLVDVGAPLSADGIGGVHPDDHRSALDEAEALLNELYDDTPEEPGEPTETP